MYRWVEHVFRESAGLMVIAVPTDSVKNSAVVAFLRI